LDPPPKGVGTIVEHKQLQLPVALTYADIFPAQLTKHCTPYLCVPLAVGEALLVIVGHTELEPIMVLFGQIRIPL
jgi:hypothetical protein